MSFFAPIRLYFVSKARIAAGAVADVIDELAAAGVGAYQLREKDMEAGDLLRVGEPIADACRRAGIPFIVNDRPDVALALGADGVHLGRNDLPPAIARRILGPAAAIGLSSHTPAEVDAIVATDPAPDYFAAGPVHATPTKPGRPAAGYDLLRHAASTATDIPWFAIGGIDPASLPDVLEAGARRIVVVRAIGDAADPVAAAAHLRAILDEAPL